MTIGDRVERLALSALDGLLQVWVTWEETGLGLYKGAVRPLWEIYSTRVVNDTAQPATFIITAGGAEYWYTAGVGGLSHVLNGGQRNKAKDGAGISLAGG